MGLESSWNQLKQILPLLIPTAFQILLCRWLYIPGFLGGKLPRGSWACLIPLPVVIRAVGAHARTMGTGVAIGSC